MMLTKNFSLREFQCKDGTPVPEELYPNVKELANNLQVLRDYLGVAIQVTSGYRTGSHNKKVGGVENSKHKKAEASDIKAKGFTPKQIAAAIEKLIAEGKMKQGGIGIYNTFVHYDIRGHIARW